MFKKLTAIAIIMVMLTACEKSPDLNPASENNQTIEQNTPPPGTADETGEDSGINGGDSSEQLPPEDEAPPEEPVVQEPVPAEKAYYMNKIYDIKPLDEETEANVVLLTFDDGPKDADMVNGMLDVLEEHDAKAIFFVNGFRVEANPELLQLIHDKGHAIGNHSWDHINLKNESEESIRRQVDDVQQIVEETIGERPQFFRPPHGASNEYLRQYVQEQGMLFMTWSNGSLDWDAKNQTPEAVIRNVFEQLRPGSNILMHELPWTVEALDELLSKLEEEGYSFVDPHAIQIEPPAEETAS